MKLNHVVTTLGLLLLTGTAQAFSSVCTLENQPLEQGTNFTQNMIDSYRMKLSQECAVYKKFNDVKARANEYGVNIDQISLYKALRYIDRAAYTWGKATNTPVEYLFQVHKTDQLKPLSEKSTIVWRNWAEGIKQVDLVKNDIAQGRTIDLPYIQQVHIGFYKVGDESGELGNVDKPGEIKTPYHETVKWEVKTQAEANQSIDIAQSINDNLTSMGLMPRLSGEADIVNKIVDVRDMYLYPANPKAVRAHLNNMFKFLNTMLAQARVGKHMVWKDRLFTPNELAYFIQQYFVQIHAFNDGNGRTSRFLQDVILSTFGMPYGATGDLVYNDMMSKQFDNYQLSLMTSYKEVLDIEKCFTEVYPSVLPQNWKRKGISINSVEAGSIAYECRLLK